MERMEPRKHYFSSSSDIVSKLALVRGNRGPARRVIVKSTMELDNINKNLSTSNRS